MMDSISHGHSQSLKMFGSFQGSPSAFLFVNFLQTSDQFLIFIYDDLVASWALGSPHYYLTTHISHK